MRAWKKATNVAGVILIIAGVAAAAFIIWNLS
jgi:hypothetical protein